MSTTKLVVGSLLVVLTSARVAAEPVPEPVMPDVPGGEPIGEPFVDPLDAHPGSGHTPTILEDGERLRRADVIGFAISAGGGLQGFTGDTLRNATDDGGTWDVRVTVGTRRRIAIEASYLGSLQQIDALGLDSDALLASNGLQGNLRVNLIRDRPWQPFVFVGAAWRRYDVAGTDTNTSDIAGEDHVLEAPLGAGIAFRGRGLVFEARGEFRPATQEDLMSASNPTTVLDTPSMHRYGATVNVGYEL